ncbi:imidazole glycerol phosphate synthase subunit HisH [Geomonas silvestris]|uniref:Imidazole glycerol phosphate synthase subunit HisH n=1 Tax=Geomonas silvestris TaxID=2740184 RepID=A0A6V8MGN0_9BACT|nr:imidazole glycerol phosphate synthase subunit HisH [Geomonas silvestris]GFO59074.1 imidazole glycerol phosphate synthase subunit HisH [Geomonas silvestris]
MIAIIDYGMGNLRSVQKGFEKIGFDAVVSADPNILKEAERVVLPGVGAFRDCMRNLEQAGFVEPILKVIQEGKPFLGICVGMQLLFTQSEEFGIYQGLNVIPGNVLRFADGMVEEGEALKVPHMGWNQLAIKREAPLFGGIADGSNVYFVHSYYVKPEDESVVAASTRYGIDFCAAIWRDNIMATQFHPEKSQDKGLAMLKNFATMK